jgi:spore germination cell wall hydrolase CwlJ-like protein
MLHKSLLGLPMLLLAASCVPPLAARPAAATFAAARAPAAPSRAPVPLPPAEAIAPGQAAAPFVLGTRSARDAAASLQCLTAAVYYEARSEGLEGQRAVAQVVLNRVRHPAFPKSVCGVVYQGSRRRTGCQFSFTCDGSLRSGREPGAWARARHVATTALAGGVYGPVGLATHYHANYVRPWWAAAMRRAVSVGSHIFYRWRGEWGDPKSFRRPYSGIELAHRPAAGPEPEEKETQGNAFGVKVHRGTPAALAAVEADAGVRVHRPAAPAAVRIHSGTPDEGETAPAAAEPPGPPESGVPVR